MYKSIAILLYLLIFTTVANAGWYFVYAQKTNIHEDKIEVYIQNTWIKISSPEKDIIFESKSQSLTLVSHKNKTSWTGNISEFDDIKATALKLSLERFMLKLDSVNNSKLELWRLPSVGQSQTPTSKLPQTYCISNNKPEAFLKFKAPKQSVYANEKLVENIWIAPNQSIFKEINLKILANTLFDIEISTKLGYEYTDAFFAIINKGLICKREVILNHKNGTTSTQSVELESAVEDEFQDFVFRKPENYGDISIFDLLSFLYTTELERKLDL